MRKLWIALVAALGLGALPATSAYAYDYEDYLDDRADMLEDMADEGIYPVDFAPATRVYVQPTRRVYLDDGERVIVRERPVVREYHRTYFIDD